MKIHTTTMHYVLGKYSNKLLDLDAPRPPDVPEGEPYLPWRLKVMQQEEFWSYGGIHRLSDTQLAYLAYFNILGPSTHNTVPQRFILSSKTNSITIVVDRKFILSASDKEGRQGTISIGCGIANMLTAARFFGLSASIKILETKVEFLKPYQPDQKRYTHFVRVSFSKGILPSPKDISFLYAMKERKVIRAEWDENIKLSDLMVLEMKRLISKRYIGVHLSIITDFQTKQLMAVFQEQSMGTVMNNNDFALELGKWLLPNNSKSTVGIRGSDFGLSYKSGVRFHKGLLRKQRLQPIEIQNFAKGEKDIVRSASGIGVISVEHDTPELRVAAGEGFEDIALYLHLRGYFTSIHAATTEVDIGTALIKARLMVYNRKDEGRPTVVFVIGQPKIAQDKLRSHSSRPMIEDIIFRS
ncbi:hypothetical protein HY407_01265 [Candidatus Gottesmanbacteria bacterium]|nr:hypothetical protein [Candidatus Gottesmanbacteria bacterium]